MSSWSVCARSWARRNTTSRSTWGSGAARTACGPAISARSTCGSTRSTRRNTPSHTPRAIGGGARRGGPAERGGGEPKEDVMAAVTMKELLQSGGDLGPPTKRREPQKQEYNFREGKRNYNHHLPKKPQKLPGGDAVVPGLA